jgi:hypothetical protein
VKQKQILLQLRLDLDEQAAGLTAAFPAVQQHPRPSTRGPHKLLLLDHIAQTKPCTGSCGVTVAHTQKLQAPENLLWRMLLKSPHPLGYRKISEPVTAF